MSATSPANGAPVLEFTRASRWYGPVIALNDVTTQVPPGVTGLLGPNGAGKSTFLKLAAGQLQPSQGEVKLLGLPAWGSPEIFHRVGLCPEADAFWENLTGRQFLMALLRFTGYDDAECRQRAEGALHQVALLDAKDRKIGGYSRGMRQRIKLAQAIAHDPRGVAARRAGDRDGPGQSPARDRSRATDGARGEDRGRLEPHSVRGRGDDEAGAARAQRAHPGRG